jgi:protein KTI12
MDDLIGRFEEPNSTRKWDDPLFTILPEDKLPLEDIYDALTKGKLVRPSMATEVVSWSF